MIAPGAHMYVHISVIMRMCMPHERAYTHIHVSPYRAHSSYTYGHDRDDVYVHMLLACMHAYTLVGMVTLRFRTSEG